MNRKTIPELILFFVVLALVGLILLFTHPPAGATGKPEPTPTGAAQASASANSAIDLSLMNSANGGAGYGGAGFGGSVKQEGSYSLVSGSAAPLPTGLCPKGDSSYVQVLWGLLTVANSSTRTEMECLDKVLAMLRETAPKPIVMNYIAPEPKVEPNPAEQPRPANLAPVCEKNSPKPAPKKHIKKPSKTCP